jgi:ubiquinone/menaquinone biosynthesis C-methylase UbiE
MVNVEQDPEQVETSYLDCLGKPAGARVLEIGCGDGRLIWRYLKVAESVYGIDPDAAMLSDAIRACPASLASKVHFALTTAEALPFADKTFDLSIMSWSL